MSKERAFKGVWIPKEIWLNPDLSPIEKLFLAEIDSLDNDEKKGCFASNEYFGNFFKISEGRAANIISGLRKRGYVVQVYFDGSVRGIRLHENVKSKEWLSLHENVKAGFTKRGKQVSRKREHNNIVNNKVHIKEEEKEISSSSSEPENPHLEAKEKKEIPPNSAAPPLEPPFTPTGEHIAPQPAKVITLYEKGLPGVTVVDSVPGTYAPNTEFRRVNIPEEIERLKTDPAAKETFALVRKIPSSLYPDYVEAFEKEIGGTGETYHNLPAFRKHFFNWCGSRYEIAQRKTNTPKTNRSQINHAGGNPDKYLEKQIF